jgi:hypothetical protein
MRMFKSYWPTDSNSLSKSNSGCGFATRDTGPVEPRPPFQQFPGLWEHLHDVSLSLQFDIAFLLRSLRWLRFLRTLLSYLTTPASDAA